MSKFWFVLFSTSLVGCATVSPRTSIQGMGGRNAYNIAIQQSTSEQMLLNIVRMRYADTPFFLDVNTITTQYTFKTGAGTSFKIPGFNEKNPASFGFDYSWQNQPTIQYAPLEGQDFAAQLMEPIDLRILQQLIFTGWDISRLFKLTLQSFDDHSNAFRAATSSSQEEDAQYHRFNEIMTLMRQLQLEHKIQLGVKDHMLQITFANDSPEARELAQLLKHAELVKNRYVVNLKVGFNDDAEIGILPRSIMGCMYYLSLGVKVPIEDAENRVANIPNSDLPQYLELQKTIAKLITIHSSSVEPRDAFLSICYHGTYFYIKDNDLDSKKTFALLQQLYNLQAKEVKVPPPILSLPLG
ncbi:MAG: hypothetical protein KBC64_07410 [Simkaniaceae bacterium]|nr:hypothetical protein [Simkaniaceae bacterium]